MNMNVKVLICGGAMSLFILSCGGNKSEQAEATSESAAVAEPQQDAIKEGEQLVAQNDCKTCHHPTNKIIGPAHTDVAKKYEFTAANVDSLANHIIKGSMGIWGQIPMNPHADLSIEDARKMARYVLSLDGEKEK
ncbi:MAG TPA: c-type cytochrome [Cyclobacteriaceae bacterium]|nr:c-type cytochrome [Cyclobacteriaceae bacterium]